MEIKVGGKFKLTKKLGQGAFGALYAAINTNSGEEVAVKLVLLIIRFLYDFRKISKISGITPSFSMSQTCTRSFKGETASAKCITTASKMILT